MAGKTGGGGKLQKFRGKIILGALRVWKQLVPKVELLVAVVSATEMGKEKKINDCLFSSLDCKVSKTGDATV